jgi:hypothetical protein
MAPLGKKANPKRAKVAKKAKKAFGKWIAMSEPNYKEAARKKFPYGPIRGQGRWAAVKRCPRRWDISLHPTQTLAEQSAGRECKYGCQGTWNHFVAPVAPPEMPPAPTPPAKTVEPPPPLIGLMR